VTGFDTGATLADRFRAHACDQSHLYGHAMRGMADDWEAGGPVREVCAGYEDAPIGSVIQLRLLAGVFRLVLTGRAPELIPYYPCLAESGGGREEPPGRAWPLMRAVIGQHIPELHQALEVAPQTNEVGRAAALLAGLFDVIDVSGCRSVRVLEVGASAGLNLLLDQFNFLGAETAGGGGPWQWGDSRSPVHLEQSIEGPVQPQNFTISGRRGCDLFPVDARSPQGQQLLTSFVWPFDLHRHRRLAAALKVAARYPVQVDQASAGDWLAQQLTSHRSQADEADEAEQLTVVWHSISQMYWPPAESERVDSLLAAAGAIHPLARITMEFSGDVPSGGPQVMTTLWRPAVSLTPPGSARGHRPRPRHSGTPSLQLRRSDYQPQCRAAATTRARTESSTSGRRSGANQRTSNDSAPKVGARAAGARARYCTSRWKVGRTSPHGTSCSDSSAGGPASVNSSRPLSSRASRSDAASSDSSPDSMWPPVCSQRPIVVCRVSKTLGGSAVQIRALAVR